MDYSAGFNYTKTGFVTKTARVTKRAIGDLEVNAFLFLKRFLENTNNFFRSYCLILLSEIYKMFQHNENEPNEDKRSPYPEPNELVQELEAYQTDHRRDDHNSSENPSDSHKKDYGRHEKKKKRNNKSEQKSDQVFIVRQILINCTTGNLRRLNKESQLATLLAKLIRRNPRLRLLVPVLSFNTKDFVMTSALLACMFHAHNNLNTTIIW